MLQHFSQKEASRLLDIPPARLRYWSRIDLVKPSLTENRTGYYNFRDLICLHTASALVRKGIPARKVKANIHSLRSKFPEFDEQLAHKRIYVMGSRVILSHKNRLIDSYSGQLLLKLDIDDFKQMVIESRKASEEPKSAGQWFREGLRAEASAEGLEPAQHAYRQAIRKDPQFADAFVNLGRTYFLQRKFIDAQRYFRQALRKNPYHAKAAFNLANVLDELGCTEEAAQWYERALEAQPDFADAYFNLARVTEKLGDWDKASRYWRAYLQFDSESEHARIARRRMHLIQGQLARKG